MDDPLGLGGMGGGMGGLGGYGDDLGMRRARGRSKPMRHKFFGQLWISMKHVCFSNLGPILRVGPILENTSQNGPILKNMHVSSEPFKKLDCVFFLPLLNNFRELSVPQACSARRQRRERLGCHGEGHRLVTDVNWEKRAAEGGQKPFAPTTTHGKPLLVGIYKRIIVPGFLRWCEMNFVHPQ